MIKQIFQKYKNRNSKIINRPTCKRKNKQKRRPRIKL